jgi:hypothetical protein
MCLELNDSYGVTETKGTNKNGKSYRLLTFAKAAILDGVIEIYGPSFIQVKWQTAIRRLPAKGRETFRSAHECKKWLVENFNFDRVMF